MGDLFAVVVRGGRLWLRHWPVLLVLALLGGALRMAALWAAVQLSDVNNTLGVLVLVLAPLASVTSIVLMLHVLRASLPFVRWAEAAEGTADRRLLDVLASVLVPFLAVYASYGFLREDVDRFLNSAAFDEFRANADVFYRPGSTDPDRFAFATGWVAVAVVAGAVVFRYGLGRLERVRRWTALGLLGGYVEALWLVTLAAHLATYQDAVWDWAESRRGVAVFVGWWEHLLKVLGPVADPVDTVTDWVLGVVSNADAIVVLPLAWLTVGAVVYGHRLVPPAPAKPHPLLARLPRPVRRWGGELVADVRDRFTALFGGVRQLAVAGLAPMLMFGTAFLLSAHLEDGLNLLARALIGPQPVDTWLAFVPQVETCTHAVGLTVTMCLLAAAIDRILGSEPQRDVARQLPPEDDLADAGVGG